MARNKQQLPICGLTLLTCINILAGCQQQNSQQYRVPGTTTPTYQHESVIVAAELANSENWEKLQSTRYASR